MSFQNHSFVGSRLISISAFWQLIDAKSVFIDSLIKQPHPPQIVRAGCGCVFQVAEATTTFELLQTTGNSRNYAKFGVVGHRAVESIEISNIFAV